MIDFIPQSKIDNIPWDSTEDNLWLLTPDELAKVPDGTEVTSISGSIHIIGTDYINDDTRFGLLAYGILESQLPSK